MTFVGKRYLSHDRKFFRCTAEDARDVTLVGEFDATEVRKVSDHAMGRNFREIKTDATGREYCPGWGYLSILG